jgi:hypothetical protein
MELQENLKMIVANRAMHGSIATMINIRKALIPCVETELKFLL